LRHDRQIVAVVEPLAGRFFQAPVVLDADQQLNSGRFALAIVE